MMPGDNHQARSQMEYLSSITLPLWVPFLTATSSFFGTITTLCCPAVARSAYRLRQGYAYYGKESRIDLQA